MKLSVQLIATVVSGGVLISCGSGDLEYGTETVESASLPITPQRIGANYTHWSYDNCVYDNRGLLQTYHLPGVRSTAQSQLSTMRANGLSSLRFMVWHMREGDQPWGVVGSAGGNLSPQYLTNWRNICNDIKNAGFPVFEVVLGPMWKNDPSGDNYDSSRFQENWSFLYNVVMEARNYYGPTVKVDLINEGAPNDYTPAAKQRLTTYIDGMWRNYVSTFGASTGTVSIADASNGWDPGRLINLYNIFSATGAFPGWWEVHGYDNLANALNSSHSFLSSRGDTRPLAVGETYYDDTVNSGAIANFSGRAITDVLVWPITRTACVSPPYDDGAYAPQPVTVYSNSFESTGNLSGWLKWHNCASGAWNADNNIFRYYTASDNPAPGGGAYALRMQTMGFSSGCQYPGAYALSPLVPATAGATYKLDNTSRNHSNSGVVSIHFYNSAGNEIGSYFRNWGTDAWIYNADPQLAVTAPVGTTAFRIRYGLNTPNAVADMDLLKVTK